MPGERNSEGRRACQHCARTFSDENALYQHARMKHRGRTRPKRPASKPFFADRAVDAEIDRAMGIYNFDAEWLLP